MIRFTRLMVLLGSAVASLALADGAPTQIAYSGRVSDNGVPLTGTHAFEFRLFASDTGGSSVWSETQSSVTVTQGLIDVRLGANQPLTATVFTGTQLYLEVVIDGNVLSPRTPVVSAPYAISAGTAATLGTLKPSDVQVRVSGSCGTGQAIRVVAPNGQVTCEPTGSAGGSGTVTSVATGPGLTGGPITTTGTIGLAPTVQNWSSQPNCGVGKIIQGIGADGTPVCATAVTSVATGTGLTGGPITGTGTVSLAATVPNWSAAPSCGPGLVVKGISYNGTAACVPSAPSGQGILGYAWVLPSGALGGSYNYNSTGQGITITHPATGTYSVTFNGVVSPPVGTPFGTFQVSAFDSSGGPHLCSLESGAFQTGLANVKCYTLAGALVDSYFDILFVQ